MLRVHTNTLVMPVSGAKFCNQIAIAKHLLGCGYRIGRIMGTSGGAVTATLLLLADVNSVHDETSYLDFCVRLNAILETVDSTWYMDPWMENASILNTAYGLCKGSLFGRGTGEMFVGSLNIDISGQPETWIGTHCKDTGKSQVWCTKPQNEATIHPDGARYINNDLPTLTRCTMASCALPTIVPSVEIQGERHSDGGTSYASPLGPCMSAFESSSSSYHVVYISPVRYSSCLDPHTEELEDDDIPNMFKSAVAGMVTQLHIPDRNNGLRFVGPNYTKTFGIGRKALTAALERSETSERSFIELAPIEEVYSDFLSLKKGDASIAVRKAYHKGFTVRQWYI